MGLDVALGIIILIAAIRGWLQGFVYQAVRLGGLVACVYLADPRARSGEAACRSLLADDPAGPDRSALVVGRRPSSTLRRARRRRRRSSIKMTRRPEIPGMPPQRSRNDQFAGFLLGIAKGVLVAAFLTARHSEVRVEPDRDDSPGPRSKSSRRWALRWNEPVSSRRPRSGRRSPVQHFVNHVQRMGLQRSARVVACRCGATGRGSHPVRQTAQPDRPEGSRGGDVRRRPDRRLHHPARAGGIQARGTADPELEKIVRRDQGALDGSRPSPK